VLVTSWINKGWYGIILERIFGWSDLYDIFNDRYSMFFP
jgi:hypothetical protein